MRASAFSLFRTLVALGVALGTAVVAGAEFIPLFNTLYFRNIYLKELP